MKVENMETVCDLYGVLSVWDCLELSRRELHEDSLILPEYEFIWVGCKLVSVDNFGVGEYTQNEREMTCKLRHKSEKDLFTNMRTLIVPAFKS